MRGEVFSSANRVTIAVRSAKFMYIYRFAKGYEILERCYYTQNGELRVLVGE